MNLPIYQVDAFTDKVFSGNPAAVCPLDDWLDSETMQAIAAENNLSETAFFVKQDDRYELRWFTPETEVDLCGHATLAAAWVLYNELGYTGDAVKFKTLSGELTVWPENDRLCMNFPSRPPTQCDEPPELIEGLGAQPEEVLASRDYLCVFETPDQVKKLRPKMSLLRKLDVLGVIATAPGQDCDFVSRFFAPKAGIPEDPVTGSAHCTLIPYWAERLGKKQLHARQISKRGGQLWCRLGTDRVVIAGNAAKYMQGTIII